MRRVEALARVDAYVAAAGRHGEVCVRVVAAVEDGTAALAAWPRGRAAREADVAAGHIAAAAPAAQHDGAHHARGLNGVAGRDDDGLARVGLHIDVVVLQRLDVAVRGDAHAGVAHAVVAEVDVAQAVDAEEGLAARVGRDEVEAVRGGRGDGELQQRALVERARLHEAQRAEVLAVDADDAGPRVHDEAARAHVDAAVVDHDARVDDLEAAVDDGRAARLDAQAARAHVREAGAVDRKHGRAVRAQPQQVELRRVHGRAAVLRAQHRVTEVRVARLGEDGRLRRAGHGVARVGAARAARVVDDCEAAILDAHAIVVHEHAARDAQAAELWVGARGGRARGVGTHGVHDLQAAREDGDGARRADGEALGRRRRGARYAVSVRGGRHGRRKHLEQRVVGRRARARLNRLDAQRRLGHTRGHDGRDTHTQALGVERLRDLRAVVQHVKAAARDGDAAPHHVEAAVLNRHAVRDGHSVDGEELHGHLAVAAHAEELCAVRDGLDEVKVLGGRLGRLKLQYGARVEEVVDDNGQTRQVVRQLLYAHGERAVHAHEAVKAGALARGGVADAAVAAHGELAGRGPRRDLNAGRVRAHLPQLARREARAVVRGEAEHEAVALLGVARDGERRLHGVGALEGAAVAQLEDVRPAAHSGRLDAHPEAARHRRARGDDAKALEGLCRYGRSARLVHLDRPGGAHAVPVGSKEAQHEAVLRDAVAAPPGRHRDGRDRGLREGLALEVHRVVEGGGRAADAGRAHAAHRDGVVARGGRGGGRLGDERRVGLGDSRDGAARRGEDDPLRARREGRDGREDERNAVAWLRRLRRVAVGVPLLQAVRPRRVVAVRVDGQQAGTEELGVRRHVVQREDHAEEIRLYRAVRDLHAVECRARRCAAARRHEGRAALRHRRHGRRAGDDEARAGRVTVRRGKGHKNAARELHGHAFRDREGAREARARLVDAPHELRAPLLGARARGQRRAVARNVIRRHGLRELDKNLGAAVGAVGAARREREVRLGHFAHRVRDDGGGAAADHDAPGLAGQPGARRAEGKQDTAVALKVAGARVVHSPRRAKVRRARRAAAPEGEGEVRDHLHVVDARGRAGHRGGREAVRRARCVAKEEAERRVAVVLEKVVLEAAEAREGDVDAQGRARAQNAHTQGGVVRNLRRVCVDVKRLHVLQLQQQRRANGRGAVQQAEGGALRLEDEPERLGARQVAHGVAHGERDGLALLVRRQRVVVARAGQHGAVGPEEACVTHAAAQLVRVPVRVVAPAARAEGGGRVADVAGRRGGACL